MATHGFGESFMCGNVDTDIPDSESLIEGVRHKVGAIMRYFQGTNSILMNFDNLFNFVFCNIVGSDLVINSSIKYPIPMKIKTDTSLWIFVFHYSYFLL